MNITGIYLDQKYEATSLIVPVHGQQYSHTSDKSSIGSRAICVSALEELGFSIWSINYLDGANAAVVTAEQERLVIYQHCCHSSVFSLQADFQ